MSAMCAYLDNAATTRCLPEAAALMNHILCEDYGNAASLHRMGVVAEGHIRHAREVIARHLGVGEKEIIFTSGGTESVNLALIGAATANVRRGRHLITTAIEHPAVTKTMEYLAGEGFRITRLSPDREGVVSPADLAAAISDETILVSMMYVNNETGAIQPIAEAAKLTNRVNPQILFHVDAAQGFAKFCLRPKNLAIDLLSASGHKIHGPKGVGILYADERARLQPISHGGNHQRGRRAGTENVAAIAAMGCAVESAFVNLDADISRMHGLRERLADGMRTIAGVTVNGPSGHGAAPHIINVAVAGTKSEVLLHALEERMIYISAGAACASHAKGQRSATLSAMGLSKEQVDSSIRLSLSRHTTAAEIEYTLQAMYDIIPMLRKYG